MNSTANVMKQELLQNRGEASIYDGGEVRGQRHGDFFGNFYGLRALAWGFRPCSSSSSWMLQWTLVTPMMEIITLYKVWIAISP